MTQRWRTLVLLYPVLDARYGSGLLRKRAQRVMTRDERAAVEAVVERLPATVEAWSDGLATLDPLDVVEVRRKVGSLSSSGGGRWWVGPRECREELATTVAPDRYDSVYVLWPGDPGIPQCGWGCTIGPSPETFGAGFSSISTEHWSTLGTDPDPEQGYVHEWLHQVEAVYRGLGLGEDVLPSLHDAGDYTSSRPEAPPPTDWTYADFHDGTHVDRATGARRVTTPARTWSPWYRDWMTGRLRRPGHPAPEPPIGLTAERWALRDRR